MLCSNTRGYLSSIRGQTTWPGLLPICSSCSFKKNQASILIKVPNRPYTKFRRLLLIDIEFKDSFGSKLDPEH